MATPLLPIETFEFILEFCDGPTLLNVAQINSKLKDMVLINPSQQLKQRWKNICEYEIDNMYKIDILQNTFPSYYIDDSIVNWGMIYKNWTMWCNLPKFKFTIEPVTDMVDTDVTCIQTSENWIFIGTNSSSSDFCHIIAFNMVTEEVHNIYNGHDIHEIKLLHKKFSENPNAARRFPDIPYNSLIVNSYSSPCQILMNLGNCAHRQLPKHGEHKLTCFYNNVSVFIKNINGKDNVTIECSRDDHEIPQSQNIKSSLSFVEVCDVWENRILCGTNESYFHIDYNFRILKSYPVRRTDNNNVQYHYKYANVIFKYDYFNLGDQNNELDISVDGFHHNYDFKALLGEVITKLLFHSGLLIIGTFSGKIYIYKINNLASLLNLNIKHFTVGYNTPDKQPIISFDVQETIDGPTIYYATKNSIYQILFSRK